MTTGSIWEGYPREMVHPSYRVDPASTEAYRASSNRLAPVTVYAPHQEDEFRSYGYVLKGENIPFSAERIEYPLMMTHPDHVDAVPASTQIIAVDGQFQVLPVPEIKERYPHVFVDDKAHEAMWEKKGYRRVGVFDPGAYERATVAPGPAGGEWPKMVNGVLCEDPSAPLPPSNEYPKCVYPPGCDPMNPPIVHSRTEEYKIMGMPFSANSGAPLLEDRPARVSRGVRKVARVTGRPRKVMSEEHKLKMAAGRKAAAERRARAKEEQDRARDARVQDGRVAERIEERAGSQEP